MTENDHELTTKTFAFVVTAQPSQAKPAKPSQNPGCCHSPAKPSQARPAKPAKPSQKAQAG